MIFIRANNKNRIISLMGEEACNYQGLLEGAITARGSYVRTGGFEMDGRIARCGIVYGSDKIRRTGKSLFRGEEFCQKVMGLRKPAPAGP